MSAEPTYAERMANCLTRAQAVAVYADALTDLSLDSAEFTDINHAVLLKWSRSGLEWIKAKAWALAKDVEAKPVLWPCGPNCLCDYEQAATCGAARR